ncbi:MAG TPA: adenosylmethionine--8-amino-7-oxononanoate transaminase [Terriglobales bacterium]|nr:adenosylmethionine--8-amino-7-oxononanoate transaminase [Terriglobales bacterium]
MSSPATELYRGHVWYPYTQMLDLPQPPEIVRGRGVWLEARDGRRYLDAISSWWVTLHGHAEPRIAAAIARQAGELEQVILSGFTHPLAEELAEKLLAIAPGEMARVFYSDDGSTAVEVALKMALQCWQQRGEPRRRRIVALEHAYHGDTLGAMSVSARSPFTAAFDGWLFPVERVPSDRLEPLAALLGEHGQEIAAVIVEPLLQAAGGMVIQPAEFLAGVRRLCDQHGVLLIADEVLTGFGRVSNGALTGAAWMFACGAAGVAPDILCLSKGLTAGFLPMAATLCTEAVYQTFLSSDRGRTLFHGHSFTGNALGCAAALASLEIFATEPVRERIAAIAAHHARRLAQLGSHPRLAHRRQAGTVAILEIAGETHGYLAAIGPRLRSFYESRGVLLRPLGPVVYVLPPYGIRPSELDEVWDVIEQSLE